MRTLTIQERAKYFAIAAHGTQTYGNGLPYYYHLEEVVEVLKEFGLHSAEMIVAGYLHDVLEDTPISFNDIKKEFDENIAEMVFAVTDELGRNRKERKVKTYPKLFMNPSAIIIKLADRIANIRNTGMIDLYRKEHPEFYKALYRKTPDLNLSESNILELMWKELERLLVVK